MFHPPGGSEDILSAVQRECTAILRDLGCADANGQAANLVHVIRSDYGGQKVYVPSGRRDRRAAIATALAAGSPPIQIARDFGCHLTTVLRIRRGLHSI